MFGIGMPELLVILAVALIVIGPKKLPDLARSLGKALGEFKRATNDLKQSFEQETGLDDVRKTIRKAGQEAKSAYPPPKRSAEKTDSQKTGESDSSDAPSSAPAPGDPPSQPANSADDTPQKNADVQAPKENGAP